MLGLGLWFDIGSLSYIVAFYALYFLIMPSRFAGSKVDRYLVNFTYTLLLFVTTFSFLAEITFWTEYQRRFNFIAIDYLLYTYEVVQNINEAYPIPLILLVLVTIIASVIYIKRRKNVFTNTFESKNRFVSRFTVVAICFIILGIFHFSVRNTQAEIFDNVNENEIAKSGLYSFFAAYNSNELDYVEFYETVQEEGLITSVQQLVKAPNDSLTGGINNLKRIIVNEGEEIRPNVIFIGMESMNAAYLSRFGSTKNLTPGIDTILKHSVAFTNLYATGTRTIRGLEAVSLSIPPTPGRSIVKRSNNDRLFTIGEVFKQKGYSRTFITGGDGHFDNMAKYFSGNGFDIVDRSKDFRVHDELPTRRTRITDDQITFENAWGACDGDIYNVVIDKADEDYKSDQPFFYMFMTNSNHSPYTYPEGIVDIPSGTNRTGAITYADKAFKQFFEDAKNKPWFKNTVFVVASDHCAYSAGRTEINVRSHHIPAFIYNLKDVEPHEVDKLASQIDIFPTLFGYLNWSYTTNLFGKDINQFKPEDERAFIANHRKLGLLKNDKLLILNEKKDHDFYNYNLKDNVLTPVKTDSLFLTEAITYYQAAYELFKKDELKIDQTLQ